MRGFEEEVMNRLEADPRWQTLPFDYACESMALLLTYAQASDGFRRRMSPEAVMFEAEEWSEDQIERWKNLE